MSYDVAASRDTNGTTLQTRAIGEGEEDEGEEGRAEPLYPHVPSAELVDRLLRDSERGGTVDPTMILRRKTEPSVVTSTSTSTSTTAFVSM
jgi:hypothetical protein